MTVTASTAKSGPYAGSGTTGPFTVGFRFLENSHLQVIRTSAAGIDTTLTLTTNYTVTGAGASSGSVTLVTPLAAGEKLTIVRNVPFTQEADYVQNDAFPAESHERALDKLTMEVQQVGEVAGRALVLPASTTGVSPLLPAPEANKVLGWNNAASGLQNFDVQSLASVVAYGTANSDIFTGNGSQTQFVLSANPGVLDNLDVSVNGLTYLPGLDYTWVGGTTVTFSVAPAVGDQVLIRYMQALAIGTSDASLVQYTPAGAGAVARTAQARLRDAASVKDFGAVGDGITNDTAALQAAINSGLDLEFPAGTYLANNLTGSTNFQRFRALGTVRITKNANGPLLTHSGNDVEFSGIGFRGDAASPVYTGNGVVLSGNNARLINCGSRWCPGVPLKITGNHAQVYGTCDIYQTTDTSATGWDIEIGVSGTATLYHELHGIYSSQLTGGIKLIDTGNHSIHGGQFARLYIAAGTSPSGVNGGQTVGARINSATDTVICEQSNAVFTGNMFGSGTFTFAAGTSSCSLDLSNTFAVAATLVNNGNANNLMLRNGSTSEPRTLLFGPTSSLAKLTFSTNDITQQWQFAGATVIPNGQSYRQFAVDGVTIYSLAGMSGANNNVNLGANAGGAGFTNVASGTGGVYAVVGGTTIAQFYASGLRPQTDNTLNFGTASQRWATVFAGTGTINTSDLREKQDISALDVAEKRVAVALKQLIKKFRFKDAVKAKGNNARIHVGVIAQEVMAAFQAENLDPMGYSIVCHDEWDAEPEVKDDDGTVIFQAREAGDRYGIRYDELLAFIIAGL